MKIQILSDLHIEFGKFRDPGVERDLTIIAGDGGVGGLAFNTIQQMQKVAPVAYTMGNHEYYGRVSIERVDEDWRERLGPWFLQMSTVDFQGLKIAGCTLWTEFKNPMERIMCAYGMNDFRCIRQAGVDGWFSPDAAAKLHATMRDWLFAQNADVVVTHHAPSFKSIDRSYNGHLDGAYYSDLDALVEASKIKLWVHGHIHRSNDYMIGGTRVVSNPRGYVGHATNPTFNPSLVVEL